MSLRDRALNAAQLEVLAWVKSGCPDGVYEDWTHRSSARTLHNRGLVIVRGRGPTWSATLTDAGSYYLEHGTYPPTDPQSSITVPTASASSQVRHRKSEKVPAEDSDREKAEVEVPARQQRPTGPMHEMLRVLKDADDNRIRVDRNEDARYRQLIASAKRYGHIPKGMQITITSHWGEDSIVALEPLPPWQTKRLKPIRVLKRLPRMADVTQAFFDSTTFIVTGPAKNRALRIIEAFTLAARDRGFKVNARLNQPIQAKQTYREIGRRDEIRITVGNETFILWFNQKTLQVPHKPTAREISRAKRGYLFPDHDEVPDENLSLHLEGSGKSFWGSSWHDSNKTSLEEALPKILEELQLRRDNILEEREIGRQREVERRQKENEANAVAEVKYQKQFLINEMIEQSKQWEEADRLRRFAAEIRNQLRDRDSIERVEAQAWAEQIEAHAEKIDPLSASIKTPEIPQPTYKDLALFKNTTPMFG